MGNKEIDTNDKKAFTLAEVLVTLIIIGVGAGTLINSAGSIGNGESIPTSLSGISSSWAILWSDNEIGFEQAYFRTFFNSYSVWNSVSTYGRKDVRIFAICVLN